MPASLPRKATRAPAIDWANCSALGEFAACGNIAECASIISVSARRASDRQSARLAAGCQRPAAGLIRRGQKSPGLVFPGFDKTMVDQPDRRQMSRASTPEAATDACRAAPGWL